jgi:hypothetical protein
MTTSIARLDPLPARTSARLGAALIVTAVVLANVAFVGLGSVFDYPDVLQRPAESIISDFKADQGAIIALFVVLALSSALLAPIAIILGKLAGNELGRKSIFVGLAASLVQVVGLSRWPLIVPFVADQDDPGTFKAVHTALGTIVGETCGYALTAVWTILICRAFIPQLAGRWLVYGGYLAAALIAVGVLVPLDVPGADFANFLGYVVWSVWLLVVAVKVWRRYGSGKASAMA